MDDHFERVLAQGSAPSTDPRAPKRSADAYGDDGARNKRRRDADTSLSREKIAHLLAEADANGIEDLDARALKTMAHALDKAIRKNALMRSKYSDEPSKFMESEIQLDEELTKWKAVAAQPALYPQLVELQVVASLLGLFAHENLDVRLDVINLLADLTDVDEDPSALAPTQTLVHHLVSHDFLPLLVKTLDDLDRDVNKTNKNANANKTNKSQQQHEDATDNDPCETGVFHALQTVENIVDVEPSAASALGASTGIFSVLLRILSSKRAFSTNKLYASEILSILVQSDRRNSEQFLNKTLLPADEHRSESKNKSKNKAPDSRLDQLLQALAPYRKHDPQGDEEEELVENLVNTLCSLLLEQDGQDQFRRLEGLELMLRFMKDRKQYVFTGALRVLDHALMHHARNCERFVEIGGLKTVFPVFMGKKAARSKEFRAKEVENVASVMASLCFLLRGDAKNDVLARFHAKFVENDMEKLDRVVDLFAKFYGRVRAAALREDPQDDDDDDENDAEAAAEERYMRRLDAGLFVLQRVALVAAHLSQFSRKICAYVMIKFHERNIDGDEITTVLREQLASLATEAGADADAETNKSSSRRQIEYLENLLVAFQAEEESTDEVKDSDGTDAGGETGIQLLNGDCGEENTTAHKTDSA